MSEAGDPCSPVSRKLASQARLGDTRGPARYVACGVRWCLLRSRARWFKGPRDPRFPVAWSDRVCWIGQHGWIHCTCVSWTDRCSRPNTVLPDSNPDPHAGSLEATGGPSWCTQVDRCPLITPASGCWTSARASCMQGVGAGSSCACTDLPGARATTLYMYRPQSPCIHTRVAGADEKDSYRIHH